MVTCDTAFSSMRALLAKLEHFYDSNISLLISWSWQFYYAYIRERPCFIGNAHWSSYRQIIIFAIYSQIVLKIERWRKMINHYEKMLIFGE